MIHVGDITKTGWSKIAACGCNLRRQPLSGFVSSRITERIGRERSGLFMDQVRIVKEMRAEDERRGVSDDFIRPRYLVWENVPGAFSSANGEDFRAVIEEIVHIKDSTCHVPST